MPGDTAAGRGQRAPWTVASGSSCPLCCVSASPCSSAAHVSHSNSFFLSAGPINETQAAVRPWCPNLRFISPVVSSSAQHPWFLSEPASLVQSRGSVAHLRCSVSPPSAVVSWRFRGRPLDLASLPAVELDAGSLTISSLQPGHAGVYQCVARVDHGPAVASRHARVAIAGTDVQNYPFVVLPLTSKQERKEAALRGGSPFCEGGRMFQEAVGVFTWRPSTGLPTGILNERWVFLCRVSCSCGEAALDVDQTLQQ